MEKVKLSFSSLNLLHTCPHNWINKQMGIPQPENEYMTAGKKAHAIIQAHVSGKKIDPRLAHIKYTFPVVEEKDFDERCGFEFPFDLPRKVKSGQTLESRYVIRGFYDGIDIENGRLLEIKTPEWSMKKFYDSPQRKLYALSNNKLTGSVLITGSGNIDKWEKEPPKVYPVPLTDQDRLDAMDWIIKGITILESGDLQTDLVDGRCQDYRCYWGKNCQFK